MNQDSTIWFDFSVWESRRTSLRRYCLAAESDYFVVGFRLIIVHFRIYHLVYTSLRLRFEGV